MTTQENRSTILEYIFRHAPVARSVIAKETQITPATVTSITGNFIQEGIIQEVGADEASADSSPGRKKILLDLIPHHAFSMGVEFTLHHIRFFICDLRGNEVFHLSLLREAEKIDNLTDFLVYKIQYILDGLPHIAKALVGIGIAVPGHIDAQQDKVITNSTTIPGFSGKELAERLPYPVICENNVRCMAFGRYLFDNASPETFAFFHIGLGMFCAMMKDGQLFQGSNYYAGEIGHTIVNPDGKKCECGKRGCLQTYCSESWILKYARFLYDSNIHTILTSLKPSSQELTLDDVSAAFSLGDSHVSSYISSALKYIGITVSNLAIIMNPDKIYLHCSLYDNKEIQEELMDYIKQQLLFVDDPSDQAVQVLPYNPFEGPEGAAAYAIKNFYIQTI